MTDLLTQANQGYAAGDAACPFLLSSPAWLAWHAGREAHAMGLADIVACRMSRGYSVKLTTAGGFKWLAKFSGDKLRKCSVESDN
jgi:hypothetical protein